MVLFELSETPQLISLRTPIFELAWSRDDGALRVWRYRDSDNIVGYGAGSAGLNVAVGGPDQWLSKRSFARFLYHRYEQDDDTAHLTIVVGLGPLKLYDHYAISGELITRQVTIENVGLDELQINGLRMVLPNACIGLPATCIFEAPGNSVRPHVPLAVAASQRHGVLPRRFFAPGLRRGSALEATPIQGPGLLALHNAPVPEHASAGKVETLLCWYASLREAAMPYVEGPGDDPAALPLAVSLGHDVGLAGWLRPSAKLKSGIQYLMLLRCGWPEALRTFQDLLPRSGFQTTSDQAAWLHDATIYATHPALYGGFSQMSAILPDFVALGVTTLVLLPIWDFANPRQRLWDGNWIDSGSPYDIRDFEVLDPTLGTPAELRALVDTAHRLGLRVLVDFTVQGCAADSRYVDEHPDWFIKDENGAFVLPFSPSTGRRRKGCYSFDLNNPELQAYLHSWALQQIEDYNFDGYRVVNPYNPALNWAPRQPYHASAPTMAMLPLLRRLRSDLRQLKPDLALICDLHGPVYVETHDGCYDYLAHHMFVHTALNRMTPAELGTYLHDHIGALPPASLRICFMETQDTCDINPLVGGLRGSRISRMLLAGMIFCGFVPALWANQEQGEEMVVQALLQLWREQPVLRYGEVFYNTVRCDSAQVFIVVRKLGEHVVLGLLNFDPHKRTVTMQLPLEALNLEAGRYRLRELLLNLAWSEEGRSTWQRDELCQIRLTLDPFGAYCVALEVEHDAANIPADRGDVQLISVEH